MIFIKARWVGMKYNFVLQNKIQLCSCKKFLKMIFFVQQHPAGDLSLLARAATEPQAQLEGGQAAAVGGGGVKRRKTAPRKLATYLTSNSNSPSQHPMEEEEEEREKENQDLLQGLINRENLLQHANKLMHHPVNLSNSNNKCPNTVANTNFPHSNSNNEPTSLDLSLPRSSPPRPSSAASSPPASPPSSTLSLLSSLQQVKT